MARELDYLRKRLAAAEQVCVLYGWSGNGGNGPEATPRQKATLQAWLDWSRVYPEAKPDPQDPEWEKRITELAQLRDKIRENTLRKIRELRPPEDWVRPEDAAS